MAYMILESSNPDFSYIIRKNPASGLAAKTLREGTLCGWFGDNEQEYCIFFKDSPIKVSYPKHGSVDFEYGNRSRYNTPMFIIDAIGSFLDSAYRKGEKRDRLGFEQILTIGAIELDQRYLSIFKSSYLDFDLKEEEIGPNIYKVVIKTREIIQKLLSYTLLFSMFAAIKTNSLFIPRIEKEQVKKYLSCIQMLPSTPYLIRYVFKLAFLKTNKIFKIYQDQLQQSEMFNFQFKFGSACDARINFVKLNVTDDENIIDVGCGEGTSYLLSLAKRRKERDVPCIGIDIDENVLSTLERKAFSRNLENIFLYSGLNELIERKSTRDMSFTVLLIEVLEHMELKDAKKLLRKLISKININKLLITTPNRGFNIHYRGIGENNFRHKDHCFELTMHQFVQFIFDVFTSFDWNIEINGIGDSVNNIQPQHSAIITRTKQIQNDEEK